MNKLAPMERQAEIMGPDYEGSRVRPTKPLEPPAGTHRPCGLRRPAHLPPLGAGVRRGASLDEICYWLRVDSGAQ